MFHKPPLSEPDVIVIDSDERKRDVFPHLETAEGKQASSMLRRLASAGNSKLHVSPDIRPAHLPITGQRKASTKFTFTTDVSY